MRTLVCLVLLGTAFAVSGPNDRQITDPKSVTSQQNANAKPVPVEDLFFTRLISDAAWSPDGKEIELSTTLTGRANLWKALVNGSWPVQMVQSDERQHEGQWSPDGKWIAFTQDTGGNELWDIYVVSNNGSQLTNLTNTPDIREQAPRWSRDGNWLACIVKAKEAPSYNVAVLEVASRQLRQLTHESDPQYTWSLVDWSPDGKTLYANRGDLVGANADVYAIDAVSGKATNLTPHTGKSSHTGTSVSRDGRQILIASNEKGGFENIAFLDVASKKMFWVTDTQWEAAPGEFSPDGAHFTYELNQDGRTDVYLGDRNRQSRKLRMPEGITGLMGPQHFSRDGRASCWLMQDRTRRMISGFTTQAPIRRGS